MASLDDFKNKYQTVIQRIEAEGVQLANLHVQDGKLFMKGTAPSLEAANKVWDELNGSIRSSTTSPPTFQSFRPPKHPLLKPTRSRQEILFRRSVNSSTEALRSKGSIIGMLVVGLIAGVVAKLLMPGKDPGGVVVTVLLGLAGSVVAGFLGRSFGLYRQGQMLGVIASVIGAILLLAVYRIVKRGAPLRCITLWRSYEPA
jgi:uncharacterized membrane protein YeaQ/YmgE (transglycosylase-associated protein family)